MPSSSENPPEQWNPLLSCGIIDPQLHCVCIGTARKGACQNRVSAKSREDASHHLEILALCSINDSFIPKLQKIAELLLCKSWHQGQSIQLGQQWYERICHSRSRRHFPPFSLEHLGQTASTEHNIGPRVTQSRANNTAVHPSNQAAVLSPNRAPVDRSSHTVSTAMIERNEIPFHVSSTRPALVSVPSSAGYNQTIALRSFRKGRDMSDVDCGICREQHSCDTVYLNCDECTGEFHWGCIKSWVMHGSYLSNFTCPEWYET